jgi:hypothetical protein
VDEDFGAFFLKFSSYFPYGFPYGARLLVNGHHYAQAQAARAGIGFTALDNGFAAVEDVPALQAICDSLDEGKLEALARSGWPSCRARTRCGSPRACGSSSGLGRNPAQCPAADDRRGDSRTRVLIV